MLTPDFYSTYADNRSLTAPFFVVVSNDHGGAYAESPTDRGLSDDEAQESLLRIFCRAEDAIAYCEIVDDLYSDQTFRVVRVTLTELWPGIEFLSKRSQESFHCPLRVDVCHTPFEDGQVCWPESIDTIWSEHETKH